MAGGLGTAFGLANAASSAAAVSATAVFILTGEMPTPKTTPTETEVAVIAPEVPTPSSPDLPDIVKPAEIETAEPELKAPVPDEETPMVSKGPVFDIVRVEQDGSVLVAGKASPRAQVSLFLDGEKITQVMTDGSGAFVTFLNLKGTGTHQTLSMEEAGPDGAIASVETVLVLVEPETQKPAKVVVADSEGVTVVQDEANPLPNNAPVAHYDLALDTISYDEEGEVVLAGRGEGDAHVRVYVDGQAVETNPVLKDGNWTVKLSGIEEGIYTLRVDELDAAGQVISRVESPFKREFPQAVLAQTATTLAALDPLATSPDQSQSQDAAVASEQSSRIIVQPGHTLWALAKDQYGDGIKYVQILNANAEAIKNPDLIYPGQIFDIPQ